MRCRPASGAADVRHPDTLLSEHAQHDLRVDLAGTDLRRDYRPRRTPAPDDGAAMSYQRSQTPTTAPLQAPTGPQNAPAFSPLLALQGLVGNAGVLDMLRPQMPGAQRERRPTPLTGEVQSVLQQGASNLTPPPAGIETPSSAVATTLADQGQGAAVTSAPSSPTTSAAAQVTALDETQGGVEGAITDSPTLTTAVADERR